MVARVLSCAVVGLDGELVDVEVDVTRSQMPATTVVGLPDAAVQESRERVRSAIRNSGLTWPANSKVVVNLAPADLKKEGPAYDLPIATGVLLASGQVVADVEEPLVRTQAPAVGATAVFQRSRLSYLRPAAGACRPRFARAFAKRSRTPRMVLESPAEEQAQPHHDTGHEADPLRGQTRPGEPRKSE